MIENEFPNVRYGETTKSQEASFFAVEAMWPCTCGKSKCTCHRRFGRYSPLAFNDRRTPKTDYDGYGSCRGTFEESNPDVAAAKLERDPYTGFKAESPLFDDPAAALAYADRLAKHGELASKYDNMTHIPKWRERHSGKIKTRVVHERSAKICKIVKAVEPEKAAA